MNDLACLRKAWIVFSTSALVATAYCFGPLAAAAPINHGNFAATNVTFLQVSEDSMTGDIPPLYGVPTVGVDSLDFDPLGFAATTSGAGGVDITDGNLKFDVVAHEGRAILRLHVREAGDTTLVGFGSNQTMSKVTANVFVEIEEVDGMAIMPINQIAALTFTPSAGDYDLQNDAGGGPFYNGAWVGTLSLDIAQILNAHNVAYRLGATKISVNLDNTLAATSQLGTGSFIAKKDFDVGVETGGEVPEPTSLAAIYLMAICAAVRRPCLRS